MAPERTSEGKWVVYNVAGQRFERWPVDAKAMLDTGEYSAQGSAVATDTLQATAPAVQSIPALTEHSPGVPLVVVKSTDAPPGQPSSIPTGQSSRRTRAK